MQHQRTPNSQSQQFQQQHSQQQLYGSANKNGHQSSHSLVGSAQGSKQQSYFVKSYCEEHPEEYITNFCNNYQCLKALCPDCIEQHILLHKQQQSFPDIESIKLVKQNCTKKIKAASQQLVTQLEELENKNLFLAEDFMDEGMITLKKQRSNVLEIVNKYFDILEKKYQDRINEFSNKGYQMNSMLEKIKNMLNELEFLHANLESPNQINTIKKICNMDLRNILDNFQKDLNNIDKEQNMYSIDVNINEKRLEYIQQELFKYTSLGIIQDYKDQQEIQLESDQVMKTQEVITLPKANRMSNNNSFQNQPSKSVNHLQHTNQFSGIESDHGFYQPKKIPQQQIVQSKIVNQDTYVNANQFNSSYQGQQNSQHQLNSDSKQSNINVYNNMNLKEIDRKFERRTIDIDSEDYFSFDCQNQYLHFFQHHDNILHLCDIEQLIKQKNQIAKFDQVQLPKHISIREFHKSIITKDGRIFLIGGKINSDKRSSDAYEYNFQQSTLVQKQSMIEARSSHSCVYLNGYIYVIGGFMENQIIKGSCERYNIERDFWEQIAELQYPVINSAVCTFREDFIFKFGGLGSKLEPNNIVEMYDIHYNRWSVIDARFGSECTTKVLQNFRLLNSSSAIQINDNEIYVFGGYFENKESSQTFVIGIEMDEQNVIDAEIRHINVTPLLYPEGFWNNTPIIYKKKIYALQNINNNQTQECIENARIILQFDGNKWTEVNFLYH